MQSYGSCPIRGSLLFLALMLSMLSIGCRQSIANPHTASNPHAASSGALIAKAQGSGMKLQVKGLPKGVVFIRQLQDQVWIGHQDGRTEYRFYRSDGTLRESRETYPKLEVPRQKIYYAADGKTPVQTEEFSTRGTLQRVEMLLPDGSKRVKLFWRDGKRLFAEGVVNRSKGTLEATFYREDGKAALLKLKTDNLTELAQEYNDKGKLLLEMKKDPSGVTVTVFQSDGLKASYRYVLLPGGKSEILEYAADGKAVVRKLLLDASGKVDTVEYFAGGVRTQVNTLNADQTIRLEEHFDSAGKVLKVVTYRGSPGLKEKLNQERLKVPTPVDPFKYFQQHDK